MGKTIIPSQTVTTTDVSGLFPVRPGKTLMLGCNITAASGTTPTLDIRVEYSLDGGTTWAIGDPTTGDAFTQRSSPYYGVKAFTPKGDFYRVRWTVGGTTPSFTFTVQEGWN